MASNQSSRGPETTTIEELRNSYQIEYTSDLYYLDNRLISNSSVKVKCRNQNCNCYPFVWYNCKVCRERWWSHCNRGYPPRGICNSCWKIQREITNWVLTCKLTSGEIQLESKGWWENFLKGCPPRLLLLPYKWAEPICGRDHRRPLQKRPKRG